MDNELEIVNNEGLATSMNGVSGLNSQFKAIGIGFAAGAAIGVGIYLLASKIYNAAKAKNEAKKIEVEPEKTES